MRQFLRRGRLLWSLGILAIVGAAVWIGFLSMGQDNPGVQRVEIKEYQGQKLGSVNDFIENSIRGVQTVDPETYQLTIDGLVAEPASYSYAQLQSMSHTAKLVTIHCVEGWSVKALWDGIALPGLLSTVEPTPNPGMPERWR